MRRAAPGAPLWLLLLLLAASAPPSSGAEAGNDGECFSTVQVAHPRAGLVAPSQHRETSNLRSGEDDGKPKTPSKPQSKPKKKKTLKEREDEDEAKIFKEAPSHGTPDLQGLALHFKALYSKVAELEARIEQLEEARDEQAELLEQQADRLQRQEALLQAKEAERAAPHKRRRATSEERAAAIQRGQQRALAALLRESQKGGAKSGDPLVPSCSDPGSDVGMGDDGLSLDFGRYACVMQYDLGWFGSGTTQLFDLDLNYGRVKYPSWLRNVNVFSHLGEKMRSLFPALPELASTFFDELCHKVVDHLSSPPATASLLLTDNKHSSVHVWKRGVSALETSGKALDERQRPRPHDTIIEEPDKCLYFKKNGEKEGTDFWTMQTYFGPCGDVKELSPDVSLGIQSKIEKWKPEQCFNHTTTFNLPIAAAAGAGVVFDVLPPTITTNFWGCFADFMQIVQGKGSMAIFGLEMKAFGLEVVDTQVPIENPIKKWSCYVAGVQEDAELRAARNSSSQEAPPRKATASLQEVKMDLHSKRVSRERRLDGEEGAKALARAMRRRPASLAETGAASRSDAEAGAQQVFELRIGDDRTQQPLSCGAPACVSFYHQIEGTDVSDLTNSPKFPDAPDEQVALTGELFQLPANSADSYGALMEGFVVAPDSGAYTFITESDNSSEVWVSRSPKVKDSDMVKVVELQGSGKRVDGTVQVKLEKGQAYYVKALFKEGAGGDYLKVGMKASDGSEHFPLPLSMLYQPPPGTERNHGLTVIDTESIGLSLKGKIREGKLSVGLDLRVGELVDLNEEFELLDFHALIKGGMSILDCVNPCFKDIAVKAWEEHIEGVV